MKALVESINISSQYSLMTISSPVSVYLKVTGCCDLHCSFCSQLNEKRNNIPIDKAKKLLKKLKQAGVVSIDYTGGEPLLYKNIKELLKYGYNLGFEQTIVTNGTHIFEDEELLKYIHTIGISLHGTEKTHDMVCLKKGTYNLVTKNIDKLISKYKNIKLLINYTLCKESINKKDINSVFNFCKERNLPLCFGRLNYIGGANNSDIIKPDNYLKIIDSLIKEYPNIVISNCVAPCIVSPQYRYLCHSCGAGQTSFAIEANGDVKICPSSSYIIGNAFKKDFNKITNSLMVKKYLKLSWLPNVCTICKNFPACKGGCHAEGDANFFRNTCDALLINSFNNVWQKIKDRKLIVDNYLIKKEKRGYLIIKKPIRKINNISKKIITNFDGNTKTIDIVNKYKKVSNIKDFIITLYIDGIIKVKK